MQSTILTIAGSDSSGGAGLQADLKAIHACGGYAATVVTAVTAQNTREVARVEALSPALIEVQLEAVFGDLADAAVKSGMLATEETVRVVATALRRHAPPAYVCDPVLLAGTGRALLSPAGLAAVRDLLFPLATLVTPNVPETEELTGRRIGSLAEAEAAARELLAAGAGAVLVKGGHLAAEPGVDLLVTADGTETFRDEWIETRHAHGTGCTLAAAIATHLGAGLPLAAAVRRAKALVTEALRHGLEIGAGPGPTNPLFALPRGD